MPLPLIIVPVFNALAHVKACLDSLTRTVPRDAQLLLIDDASTDGSTERLEEIPWIRLIVFRSNRGPGAARGRLCGLRPAPSGSRTQTRGA